MANFKRRRPKNQRGFCFCKAWKHNGFKGQWASRTMQEKRATVSEREQRNA